MSAQLVSTCDHCEAEIRLVPFGQSYKWVSGKFRWRCGDDPLHPVRAHAPRLIAEKYAEGDDFVIDFTPDDGIEIVFTPEVK